MGAFPALGSAIAPGFSQKKSQDEPVGGIGAGRSTCCFEDSSVAYGGFWKAANLERGASGAQVQDGNTEQA
jgi:hypothetical protein